MGAVIMPELGFATRESTILRWLHEVGAPVLAGHPLLEVASEKTIFEVPAPEEGVLAAIHAPPGAVVPQGETIAWLGAKGEVAPPTTCRIIGWAEEIAAPPPGWVGPQSPQDISLPQAGQPTPQDALNKPYRGFLRNQIRPITAERMAHSWRAAPKVDLFAEIDCSAVTAHRAALKAAGETAPPFNVYVAHATVCAIRDLPDYNGNWIGDRLVPLEGIHVAVAVALGDNLITATMRDLQDATLPDISTAYRGVIRKALRLSLSREELWEASITLTSLGEFGVSAFTAVLNPPQIFILAIGELADRAVPREGQVVIRPYSTVCLSFDHRAVDGAPASRLLQRFKHHMEHYPSG